MTNPAEDYAQRQHDALAVAIQSSKRGAATLARALEDLRQFHHASDLDYMDAARSHMRITQELRNLARIAQIWGGQP